MFIMNIANAIALLNTPPRRVNFKPDEDLEEVKVFDAINKQNREEASSCMKEHLLRTMDIYKKYLSNAY